MLLSDTKSSPFQVRIWRKYDGTLIFGGVRIGIKRWLFGGWCSDIWSWSVAYMVLS
ncbi:hypothetical protein HanPSC8_Chr13g0557541 [Helianthus annuus]|nr:hypothetical protein HanPSC8_Chr13g0557541 [Helianthus annuus]